MSVFKARCVSPTQASVYATDSAVTAGVSRQKTVNIAGPHNVHRTLHDGDTFTDNNYYLRYCSTADGGRMAVGTEFLTVLSNDGSAWDDFNTADVTYPLVVDYTLAEDSTYTTSGNYTNLLTSYSAYSVYTQITTNATISAKINNSASAILTITSGTQSFDRGDASITALAFACSAEGGATVQVLYSLRTLTNT